MLRFSYVWLNDKIYFLIFDSGWCSWCIFLVLLQESFRKVYEWKYISCLELWTGAICAYSSEVDFSSLAYPLTQIILGVSRLVPTARYFPLRLRCIRMLNRIAAATGTFIPVSMLLLDMLEMKELNKPPTGGVGKTIDFHTVLKVIFGIYFKFHPSSILCWSLTRKIWDWT